MAITARVGDRRSTPSRDRPIQSPSRTSPASVVASRTARVTSAGSTLRGRLAHAGRVDVGGGRRVVGQAGRRTPRRCCPVGTTRTVLSLRASTCSATGRMFLLLGRITTSSESTSSTASRSLCGRRVHRLAPDHLVVDAERAEDPADPVTGDDRHHARRRRRARPAPGGAGPGA